jgi:uncharacterized OB-fold protein
MAEDQFVSLKGKIRVPYEWTAGEAPGRFLTSLRDEKKIIGARCTGCGRVYVPPQEFCGACFDAPVEYMEVGQQGEVVSFTVVHRPLIEVPRPLSAPFAIALIKLDGADTAMIHYLGEAPLEDIKCGMRVKAVWRDEREGSILDILYFKPL